MFITEHIPLLLPNFLQPDFARFLVACYKICILTEHDFLLLFLKMFLDKVDDDNYRYLLRWHALT